MSFSLMSERHANSYPFPQKIFEIIPKIQEICKNRLTSDFGCNGVIRAFQLNNRVIFEGKPWLLEILKNWKRKLTNRQSQMQSEVLASKEFLKSKICGRKFLAKMSQNKHSSSRRSKRSRGRGRRNTKKDKPASTLPADPAIVHSSPLR